LWEKKPFLTPEHRLGRQHALWGSSHQIGFLVYLSALLTRLALVECSIERRDELFDLLEDSSRDRHRSDRKFAFLTCHGSHAHLSCPVKFIFLKPQIHKLLGLTGIGLSASTRANITELGMPTTYG
jgi:hypothetical protein